MTLLERLADLRGALVGLDPAVLSGEDCLALAEALAATEKACAAARARAALHAGDCGVHRSRGFHRPEEWLARASGTTPGEARAALETAGALQRCPQTKAALAAGELSLAQAGEIARTEAVCPGSEQALVALARRSDIASLREEGRRRRLAPELQGAVCVEEGCGRRYGLEWDHVDPVANGGATSLENLKPHARPTTGTRPSGTAGPACSGRGRGRRER